MPTLPVSIEAIEELALRVRAAHVALARASLDGAPEPVMAIPDASSLAYSVARSADRALGVLVAEAVALDALREPTRTYLRAWEPIVLTGEAPVALRSLPSVLALETNEHRRSALATAANAKAMEHQQRAREVVEALRGLAPALGVEQAGDLHDALGLGTATEVIQASEAVLAATEDCYRELDRWIRPRVTLPRGGQLPWWERFRTLAAPRASALIPLGDRRGIASRWIARVGLAEALARVRDDTHPPAIGGAGVRAWLERPGEKAVIAGTPSIHALGAVDLTGAVAEALALVIPSEERLACRLGVDRVHHAVAETLGRRLFLEPVFVVREASVDRGQREAVLLECLYAELLATRVHAALARFAVDVLARAGDLPVRWREYLFRATGSAPEPVWAVHCAARIYELRPGPRTIASVVEPWVRERLREQHDEDWFRNPRAGEMLQQAMDGMRSQGTVNWITSQGQKAIDPTALAKRVAETMREALR